MSNKIGASVVTWTSRFFGKARSSPVEDGKKGVGRRASFVAEPGERSTFEVSCH